MIRYLVMLALALCALALFSSSAFAVDYQKVINVKDAPYNAVGDGITDDTAAIQAAITAACNPLDPNACHTVYFPNGDYRITSTLNLYHTNPGADGQYGTSDDSTPYDMNLSLVGQGRMSDTWRSPTKITYDGAAGGNMVTIHGVAGLTVRDLQFCGDRNYDSVNMAGKGFEINSRGGHMTFGLHFERVSVTHCTTGIEWGSDGDQSPCASDSTFIDLVLERCTTGFWTKSHQNVNYIFLRPIISFTDIGLYFQKGGSVSCTEISGTNNGIGVKIDNGDLNDSNFYFNSCKLETILYKGKRTIAFDVAGNQTTLMVSNLCTGNLDIDENGPDFPYSPIFKVGANATVTVDTSNLTGKNIAEITGYTGASDNYPTFVQFNNCIFNGSDPRQSITCNNTTYAGFALYNCKTAAGMIPTYEKLPTLITPEPPTNLTAAVVSTSQINLAWTDVNNETGYEVMRSTIPFGVSANWASVGTTATNVVTFQSTGLTAGTKYYYRVHSKLGSRVSFDSNTASNTTAVNALPTTSLKLLLKADDTARITKDGSNRVSAWADSNGGGYSLTQGTDANKPIWVASQLNGKAILRFTTSPAQWLDLTGQSWSMKHYSVFIVMKPTNTTNYNQQIGPGWNMFSMSAAASGACYVGSTADTSPPGRLTPTELGNGTYTTGSWQIFGMTHDSYQPTEYTGLFKFYKGGTLLASRDLKSPTTNWTGFKLGSNDSNTLNGDVAEVIVYSTALSDTDRISVETYLKSKYNL